MKEKSKLGLAIFEGLNGQTVKFERRLLGTQGLRIDTIVKSGYVSFALTLTIRCFFCLSLLSLPTLSKFKRTTEWLRRPFYCQLCSLDGALSPVGEWEGMSLPLLAKLPNCKELRAKKIKCLT